MRRHDVRPSRGRPRAHRIDRAGVGAYVIDHRDDGEGLKFGDAIDLADLIDSAVGSGRGGNEKRTGGFRGVGAPASEPLR